MWMGPKVLNIHLSLGAHRLNSYHRFAPKIWFQVSAQPPAKKNGQFDRKRNFGNVGRATVPAGIWSARWPTLRNSDEVSYKER